MLPNAPIVFWQYFDFFSLSVLSAIIGSLLFLQIRRTRVLPSTISESIAASPKSRLIFGIVMTIFFPLYYAFLWFWVGPKISAPLTYYFLIVLAFFSEIVFVWMPAIGKTKKLHTYTALLVGSTMLLLSVIVFLFGDNLSVISKWSILLFWLTSFSLIYIVGFHRKHTFVAEVVYCIGFLVMISIIAHS